MSNKIKQEVNKIDIPKELSARSKSGVNQAKLEMNKSKRRFNPKGVAIATALLVSIGAFTLFNHTFTPPESTGDPESPVVTEDGSVQIPAIELPEDTSDADMIGLIVYNGKIYTQTRTEIDGADAKGILGEKLGTTKGTIDEWSKQEDYAEELASSIGKIDVYAVNGYDKGFRIMAYKEQGGEIYTEFYENLNGITINNGEDVFGKLNMEGNVTTAQWRTYSDWNNGIDNFQPVADVKVVNDFIGELNKLKPHLRTENSDPIRNLRSDESYRELIVHLQDGTRVRLTLLKGGYVYYGIMGVYFEVGEEVFSPIWEELQS